MKRSRFTEEQIIGILKDRQADDQQGESLGYAGPRFVRVAPGSFAQHPRRLSKPSSRFAAGRQT